MVKKAVKSGPRMPSPVCPSLWVVETGRAAQQLMDSRRKRAMIRHMSLIRGYINSTDTYNL